MIRQENGSPPATILIRLMVGVIFFAEGVQKFLYAEQVGAGRFAKIGLPSPEILAPFVVSIEMACGFEARTDLSMICGLLFLVLIGPGPLSLDAKRERR